MQTWLASGDVVQVSDQQALYWYNQASILWALVIPPFVLVQETIKKEG
ncbi:MAG: DUF2288 family protein [Porticoccaceae bacterium]